MPLIPRLAMGFEQSSDAGLRIYRRAMEQRSSAGVHADDLRSSGTKDARATSSYERRRHQTSDPALSSTRDQRTRSTLITLDRPPRKRLPPKWPGSPDSNPPPGDGRSAEP